MFTLRDKNPGELQGEGGSGTRGRGSCEGNCPPKASAQRCRTKRGDLSSRRKLCHTVSDYLEVKQDKNFSVRKVTFSWSIFNGSIESIFQKAVGWGVNEK